MLYCTLSYTWGG